MLHALLDSTLTLHGLFEAVTSEGAPEQANDWLHTQREGCHMRSAASLAHTVAEQYKMSAPAHQLVPGLQHTLPQDSVYPEMSDVTTHAASASAKSGV